MKRVLIALLFPCAVLAQQAPSPEMIQGFTAALERQRNEALNQVAAREGQLAEAAKKAKDDAAEIERLKKACGEPCKPKKD